MYKKYTLDNGLRVVTEKIPFVKSISIGIWIQAGSIGETMMNNGVSHFIEHMLFKGTTTKSAKDIAEIIDGVGGQINAFTSKECTCYYIKVIDSHYNLAIELLADMLFFSKFDLLEIDKERSVIIEEINMYEDSPEDLAHDLLSQEMFKQSALGLPILGTKDTLNRLDKSKMLDYMSCYYIPENSVVSVAGNFNEEYLLKAICNKFEKWQNIKSNQNKNTQIKYNFEHTLKEKEIEQIHLCLGFKSIPLGNKSLYPLLAINNILGGSMSSRLFQKIREDEGLAYSIYSYPSTYTQGGLLTIYAGMNPQYLEQVTTLIFKELNDIQKNGISNLELQKAKEQLKGNYILGLESTSSRMTAIGKSELLLKKIYNPKQIIDKIQKISMADVEQTIDEVINMNQFAYSIVGKIENCQLLRKL